MDAHWKIAHGFSTDVQFPASQDIKTDVLDLTPLPISALQNDRYEKLYTKFETFNPVSHPRP